MGYLRDVLLYFIEPALLPELATYETEIFAGTLLVSILTFALIFWLCCMGKAKGQNVCLLGLSDSGKTLLYLRIISGSFMRTQNSIKENELQYERSDKKGKPITLVDVPGNERMRERIFARYKNSLRAVILVVDSVNFDKEVSNVAGLLYDLLSDPVIHKKRVSLLIACNKQDLTLARRAEAITKHLEKEITALRVSRSARPSSLDGGPRSSAPVTFGKKGKDFEFSDLSLKVKFVECSARGKGAEGESVADIDQVLAWLDKQC